MTSRQLLSAVGFATAILMMGGQSTALAQGGQSACADLPSYADLQAALATARTAGANGYLLVAGAEPEHAGPGDVAVADQADSAADGAERVDDGLMARAIEDDDHEVAELDINPLLASPDRLLALDARVILHPPEVADVDLPRPAIRPYPRQYASAWTSSAGPRPAPGPAYGSG